MSFALFRDYADRILKFFGDCAQPNGLSKFLQHSTCGNHNEKDARQWGCSQYQEKTGILPVFTEHFSVGSIGQAVR